MVKTSMKIEDLSVYFQKKIAKPIAYDIMISKNSDARHRYYSIEPTAVRDGILHVVVNLKYEFRYKAKQFTPCHLGEVHIPLREGDTLESIFDMAIAAADFSDKSRYTELVGADEKMKQAYEDLTSRHSQMK